MIFVSSESLMLLPISHQ